MSPWSQDGAAIRFDWGLAGLEALLDDVPGPALVVVVDVLSFSTAVVSAVERGAAVRPVPPQPAPVVPEGAVLAGMRGDGRVSLSPGSYEGVAPGSRVVLPSPNGAAISAAAAARGARVLAGCIRNAGAVARTVRARLLEDEGLTAVVLAAGERWPDGTLRVALEDLAGAARILDALPLERASPEARAAASVRTPADALADCASARELIERGWGADVTTALEEDGSATVPELVDGWFVAR